MSMHWFGALLASMVCLTAAAQPKADPPTKGEPKPTESPSEKKYEWPKEIGGRKMDVWIKEMRDKDASRREAAIRTLPSFGPDVRSPATENLLLCLKDNDLDVRLAAVAALPLIGVEDSKSQAAIAILASTLDTSGQYHTRHEILLGLAGCGPLARSAIPEVNKQIHNSFSWQLRKTAAYTLGRIGQAPDDKSGPSAAAMIDLMGALKDSSHLVRREALNSMMVLGPPTEPELHKSAVASLKFMTKDTDVGTALWAHTGLIRFELDPKKIDAKNVDVQKLFSYTISGDPYHRAEALQAIGCMAETLKFKLPELIALAQDATQPDPGVNAYAIWVLTQIPSEAKAVLPVVDELRKSDKDDVKYAAEAAYKMLTEKKKK